MLSTLAYSLVIADTLGRLANDLLSVVPSHIDSAQISFGRRTTAQEISSLSELSGESTLIGFRQDDKWTQHGGNQLERLVTLLKHYRKLIGRFGLSVLC